MNTKGTKFLAVMAVLAMAFGAFAVVDNGATEDAADITYIHGEIIADQEYFSGKIVVDQDLLVKNGATLSIYGNAEFIVPADVTLTIDGADAGNTKVAKLIVNNGKTGINNAFITIDGAIVVGEEGIFDFTATDAIDSDGEPIISVVNGSVTVNRGGQVFFKDVYYQLDSAWSVLGKGYDADGEKAAAKMTAISKKLKDADILGTAVTYTKKTSDPSTSPNDVSDRTGFVFIKNPAFATTDKITYDIFDSTGNSILRGGMKSVDSGSARVAPFYMTDEGGADGVFADTFKTTGSYTLVFKSGDKVILSENINVGGNNYIPSIIFAEGSEFIATSTGIYTSFVSGNIIMESGSSASITANIGIADVNDYLIGKLKILALDVQKFDKLVYECPASIVIDGDKKATSASDLSKFTISVEDNTYNAWIDSTPLADEPTMEKVKVIEEILNVNMNLRSGEKVDVKSFETFRHIFVDKKTDGEFIFPASSVVFQDVNEIRNGNLFLVGGNTYIAEDASVSYKYNSASGATQPELRVSDDSTLHVAGTLELFTDNFKTTGNPVKALMSPGKLCIDGGVVTITKKTDGAAMPGFPFYDIKGALYLNDDKDVLTIADVEVAFAAAKLDSDINQIILSGFVSYDEEDAYVVASDLSVWDGLSLVLRGYIIIDEDVTLTIEKDGDVRNLKAVDSNVYAPAYIDVKGAILDYNCNISALEKTGVPYYFVFNYSVILTDENNTSEAYMSFANAMKIAEAGDEIEIVKNVDIEEDEVVTIPAGVEVTMKKNASPVIVFTIEKGGKLVNKGIFDTTNGELKIGNIPTAYTSMAEKDIESYGVTNDNFAKYLDNQNIIVLGTDNVKYVKYTAGTPATVDDPRDPGSLEYASISDSICPAGFYGEGKIFDEKTSTTYLLSADAAQASSALLTKLDVKGEVNVSEMTLVSDEDNSLDITVYGEFIADEIVLDKYCSFKVGSDGKFTGAITFVGTTAGESTAVFDDQKNLELSVVEEEEDDDVVITTVQLSVTGLNDFEVASGEIKLVSLSDATKDIVIDSGAILSLGKGVNLQAASVLVDGTLAIVDTGVVITVVDMLINGALIVDEDAKLSGTISVLGTIVVDDELDDEKTLEFAGKMYLGIDKFTDAVNTIVGIIDLSNAGYLYDYGYDLSEASIVSGKDAAEYVEFYIDGVLFVTVYSKNTNELAVNGADKIPSDIIGYELPVWYSDADLKEKDKISSVKFGTDYVAYGKLVSKKAALWFSTGVGITLYIDDLKVDTSSSQDIALPIGTYAIKAIVQPGYQSDVKIVFNGQEIKDGKFTITPELAEEFDENVSDEKIVVTAMGDVQPIPEPVPGMSITEILLIVLVILIAIMAVIVALRLNRS